MRGIGVRAGVPSLVAALCCVVGVIGAPALAFGEAPSSPAVPGSSSSLVGSSLVVQGVQSLDEGQQAQNASEAQLSNPEAVAEREASRTRFEGLGPEQARAEAAAAFPNAGDTRGGGLPPLPTGEKIVGFDEPDVARVDLGGGQGGIVESTVPMAMQGVSGAYTPVDLGLHDAGGAFEPANPLVSVRIPKRLGEGVQLPSVGISLTPVDGQDVPLGGSE